jgi:hypothetical protein
MFTPGQEAGGVATGESGSFPSIDALPVLDDSAIQGLELSTGDLKPFIPEDVQRQITQHVVHAVKAAPIGKAIDPHQLAFVVDSNFSDLFDGSQFDFNPVLGGLRDLGTFQDEDIYVAVVRLEQKLHGMGYGLAPVTLQVDPQRASELIEEAETRDRIAAQEAANTVAQTRASLQDVPEVAPPQDEDRADSKETRKDASLAKWGIKKKGLTKKARVIRYAALLLVGVAIGATGFLTAPNRKIRPEMFTNTVPMSSATLKAGGLNGVLDDTKWWKIPFEDRTKRIAAFRRQVEQAGYLRSLQVRDGRSRVVMAASNDGRILTANFFEFGHEDGSIPDEQLDRMMAKLPAEVKKAIKARQERDAKKRAENDTGGD